MPTGPDLLGAVPDAAGLGLRQKALISTLIPADDGNGGVGEAGRVAGEPSVSAFCRPHPLWSCVARAGRSARVWLQ